MHWEDGEERNVRENSGETRVTLTTSQLVTEKPVSSSSSSISLKATTVDCYMLCRLHDFACKDGFNDDDGVAGSGRGQGGQGGHG